MSQLISNLSIGSKIKYGSYQVEGSTTLPIIWKLIDKNHTGYPANSITLLTDKIIDLRGFDAKEPSNANSDRRSNGNGRYRSSNLRQWLNSGGAASAWWTANNPSDGSTNTNNKDTTPNDAGMWQPTGYSDIQGFMSNFTTQERAQMLDTTLTVAKNAVTDSGGSETVTDKIFLLSNTEVRLANENGVAEGSGFSIFAANADRVAYMTAQGLTNTLSSNKPSTVNTAWFWWLRTPDTYAPATAHMVHTSGSLYDSSAADGANGVRPAMNLSSSILVSDSVDEDGAYTVIWWSPPNLKPRIDGASKSMASGSVRIDGALKAIDSMWVRIDGALKKL